MENYIQLDVWKTAIELMKEIHVITTKLPKEERYDGVDQARRASKSILANIAEGSGRYTYKDRASKFVIARGECYEIEAFLYIFISLGYITAAESKNAMMLIEKVKKILSGCIRAYRAKQKSTASKNKYRFTNI